MPIFIALTFGLIVSIVPRAGTSTGPEGCGEVSDQWRVLDFGNPAARSWAVERFSGLIQNLSIGIYRQDANIDPMYYWWTDEAEDRQGMTEIKYVMGMYSYWDELQRRNPSLIMDSCASVRLAHTQLAVTCDSIKLQIRSTMNQQSPNYVNVSV